MRKVAVTAIVLLAMVGCDGGESPRLSRGSTAMVTPAWAYDEAHAEPPMRRGDTVQVQRDGETAVIYKGGDVRKVDVLVLDGASKGKVGTIARAHLTPLAD